MKQYFYHKVPERMVGNILFPLNMLPQVDVETYELARVKYTSTDRENLFDFYNPILDCLWNDVIFMLAVHPQKVFQAADDMHLKIKRPFCYYKIDTDLLDPSLLGVYQARIDHKYNRFDLFDKKLFESYATLPQDVYTHFESVKKQPRETRMYFPLAYVPHVLYKGTIDISGVEIIQTK